MPDAADRRASQPDPTPHFDITHYRQMVESAGEVIFTTTAHGYFTYVNPAVHEILGYAPGEVVGRHYGEFIVPDWRDQVIQFYRDQLSQGVIRSATEFPLAHRSGQARWVELTVNLMGEAGAFVGFLGFLRDIHDRKLAEDALREAHDELEARVAERTAELMRANDDLQQQIRQRNRVEQALQNERNLLRTLIDHLPDFVYVKDTQSRFVLGNTALAALLGVSEPEQMVGRTDFDFFPPETAAQYYGDERHLLLTGLPLIDHEERSRNQTTGENIWLLTSKVPVRDSEGRVSALVGVGRDITARKQSEDQQRAQQTFLRQLIDNNPNLIFVKDIDGRFTLVNKSLADLFGSTPEEILGKTDADFIDDADVVARFLEDDREVITTLKPRFIAEEKVYNVTTGEWRWVQTNKLPFLQADGSYQVLGIATDITERKNAEQQALALAVERERVRVLANFIRDASHDFRTPLSTINTSLYLLGRTHEPERQREHMAVIQEQTVHLGKLLEGMLKMARLDSEHFFRFNDVDVNHLMEMIHLRERQQAEAKELAVSLSLAPRPLRVRGDAAELERAITEIVRNAIQFTPPGQSISLAAAVENSHGIISVHDTGIGIDEADQPRIFERFFRADRARSTETGGVGLGLSIAQKIIEAHGGTIGLESTPGQGSVFRIYLPLAQPNELREF